MFHYIQDGNVKIFHSLTWGLFWGRWARNAFSPRKSSSSRPRTRDDFASSNFDVNTVDWEVVDVDVNVGKTMGGVENDSVESDNKSSMDIIDLTTFPLALGVCVGSTRPSTIKVSTFFVELTSELFSVAATSRLPSPIITSSSKTDSCFDFSDSIWNESESASEAASRSSNWSEC